MKLIHVSDVHLTRPGNSLYGTDPAERLHACVASINRDHSDADLCVITGDLAHDGEPEAYQALDAILQMLSIPVQLLIGNHDRRDHVIAQFPRLAFDEHGFVQTSRKTPVGTCIFMDTVQAGVHAGVYCEQRQQWLAQRLEMAAGDDVFLFMHHAPLPTGMASMTALGIAAADAAALKHLITAYGRVRHLFFGHYHRPMHGTWAGVGFSCIRGLNHQIALPVHGDETLRFNHEPPSYAIVLIENDTLVIHHHDFMDPSAVFAPRLGGADEGER
jgi:3',5'-cyclic AMP phosphodiesterase CpdA